MAYDHDVGSGLRQMMAEDGSEPAACSTFLPLGRHPAEIEQGVGRNGVHYEWHLATGAHFRFQPDSAAAA